MEIIVNTQLLEDANDFGEALRKYCFVGPGYGCYSSFDLRPEFQKKEPTEKVYLALFGRLDSDEWWNFEEEKKRVNYYSNGTVEVAWYWDGDGSLWFKEGNREAINHDCKHDYEWKWGNGK